ncbi:hypothetical protein EKK58_02840 [Candidatus Dependentiae bacterium]|nr:MAG: hypothetical protein EKK58_02840 [Candidatus Dependentiae bacterium]
MVRKNINPSIHTKEGLQKIADCLNNYIVCNHPGIVPLNSELVSWAEHGVVIKYDSYTEKIIDISLNVYHLQYDPQSNNYDAAIKEIKQCNKHAKYLYYYLNIFLKKLQK